MLAVSSVKAFKAHQITMWEALSICRGRSKEIYIIPGSARLCPDPIMGMLCYHVQAPGGCVKVWDRFFSKLVQFAFRRLVLKRILLVNHRMLPP